MRRIRRAQRVVEQEQRRIITQTVVRGPRERDALLVFDAERLSWSHGAVDFSAIRAAVDAAISGTPHYRRKLSWFPLEGHPVWVDDHEFRLDYHVRHDAQSTIAVIRHEWRHRFGVVRTDGIELISESKLVGCIAITLH